MLVRTSLEREQNAVAFNAKQKHIWDFFKSLNENLKNHCDFEFSQAIFEI